MSPNDNIPAMWALSIHSNDILFLKKTGDKSRINWIGAGQNHAGLFAGQFEFLTLDWQQEQC